MKGYLFDETKHVHTLDGKRLYGVTSVLSYWGESGALVNWAAKQAVEHIEKNFPSGETLFDDPGAVTRCLQEAKTAHLKKRDKAGDVGTQVHKELEDVFMQKLPLPNASPVVTKVVEWSLDTKIRFLSCEKHVHSRKFWYGGIADGIIEKDGKRYILDFKTSGTIQTKAFYQCAAYSVALQEMGEEPFDGVVIIHIPRGKSFNPKNNVYWNSNIKELEHAWLCILKTFKLDKELQKQTKW